MIATLLLQSANGRLALGPIDLIIVVVYFILVLGLGLYLKKYTNTGEEFFMLMTSFVAKRKPASTISGEQSDHQPWARASRPTGS